MATISGVWLLHLTGDMEFVVNEEFASVSFNSNGKSFSSIKSVHTKIVDTDYFHHDLYYGDVIVADVVWDADTGSIDSVLWVDEKYAYLDFGETPQFVDADFYDSFTQNASPVANSRIIYGEKKIPLVVGKTVILKCSEKVFASDIEIYNDFDKNTIVYISYNGNKFGGFSGGKALRLKCAFKKAKTDIQIEAVTL